MSANTFVALLMFLFPLAYSPGPGNAFFAAIGASKGLRAAVPALAGYHVATFVVTALIGLGMGVTILNHPVVAKALSVLGSLYVLWLAFSFIRAARAKASPRTESVPPKEQSIGFWAGAIVLLLNPKAYYILAVMFTQFLRPSVDDNVLTVLAITTVFTLNNLIAFIVWALGGRALTTLFRSERSRRWIDYLFAATLIAVAIWMAVPLFT
ncbi:LysE family translocator [Saccharopolyspora elongata]|uniref:LysE family translocator n=1 Tax=Saccharopolyspora elongata TaxID=2530387 RepID=A0A4R4YU29_9PSEU|nr:LysE family translocator [Saccharopolyspora elongata]TDD47944.1 LysE family translocator [Saccharopolyspora elongata]